MNAQHAKVSRTIIRGGGTALASIVVVMLLMAGWGLIIHGSVAALPAILQGRMILVEPGARSLGGLPVGRRTETSFNLINLTSGPILINGVRTSCTCLVTEDMPLEIPPAADVCFT